MNAGQESAAQPVLVTTAEEVSPADPLPAVELVSLQQQAEQFVRAAKAPSTLRAYRSDWDHFTGWCNQHRMCALPASPETVALYLTALAATHRPGDHDAPRHARLRAEARLADRIRGEGCRFGSRTPAEARGTAGCGA